MLTPAVRTIGQRTDLAKSLRVERFYERFSARGQIERVARVHRELGRVAGIEARKRKGDEQD
jgi:hypothetical protein